MGGVLVDVDDVVAAEQMLREGEERQAFLLKLSGALRPLSAFAAVTETACRVLMEHLKREPGAARAEKALREREADLARVQRIGEVAGSISMPHTACAASAHLNICAFTACPRTVARRSHADWLTRVYPDDRHQAGRALFDALESDARSYDGEYRIVRPSDGAVRWIHARADIERDANGNGYISVTRH